MGRTSQEVGVMPKETIHSRYEGHVSRVLDKDGNWVESDPSKVAPEPFLTVGWGRESQHVQVATLAGGDYDEVGGNQRPGLYVQLDRDGINRLIRALRKARDAAFGADA
jgi:hypothetical protein